MSRYLALYASSNPLFSTLVDTFSDGTIDLAVWTRTQNTGATATESGGRLTLALPAVSAGYASLLSVARYDLTGNEFDLEGVQMPTSGGSYHEAYVWIGKGGVESQEGLVWRWTNGGSLIALQVTGGVEQAALYSATYANATHRWWKIRESGGTVSWETSADGVTYVTRATLATPSWVTSATVEIGADTVSTASPGSAIFDNVNAAPNQVVFPASTVSAGSWLTNLGGADLHTAIDETIADDTDYIQSSVSPSVADLCKVRVGVLASPSSTSSHIVTYRYGKDAAGGDRIDVTVTLYDSNGTSVIATRTHTDVASGFADGTFTLTGAEAGAMTGYAAGLVLGFSSIKV